jgi:endo-1,4-beta-xylanase
MCASNWMSRLSARRGAAGSIRSLHSRGAPWLAAASLAALLALALVPAAGVSARSDDEDRPSLRELAENRHKLIGSAVDTRVLATDPAYRAVLEREFSSVTPENVMKWEVVEPQRGVFDYAAADNLVRFAAEHEQLVRGHTLVWHNQLPNWLTRGSFTNADLADILHQHITQEASHFRGQLYAWDVVNEPFNEDGTWRDTIWFRALGPDYVALAFQWAHEADPRARLYINDYNLESIGPKSNAMYALVKDLRARDVPIHGVGFQGHLAIQYGFPGDLSRNLQRFAALDTDVTITEADVRMILPESAEKLAKQADYFARMLQACLDVRRCVSFTVWGFTDAHSWVPDTFKGQGAATPFDANLQPKPAYFALVETLRRDTSRDDS